jgi:hypothetical protein
LIQTEFINLVKELNNKIGNLSQYIETIKKDINDCKIKNKLINLFRGYIIPIEYKENKTSRYTFDMDNFENNYILINIISDYCELKFSSGDKYYKNFEIKIAFEIILDSQVIHYIIHIDMLDDTGDAFFAINGKDFDENFKKNVYIKYKRRL